MLSEGQYQQLIKFGYLEVTSPTIIVASTPHPPVQLACEAIEGQRSDELCLQPARTAA